MLIGEFETKLTDKNRLAIPKKFRGELSEKLIVSTGYDGCLLILNESMFLSLTKEVIDGRFINNAVRDTTRFLIGSAQEIEIDSQGRFVLPQNLKEFAKIKSEAVFIGLIRWIEIWDKNLWQNRKDLVIENSGELAKEFEQTLKSNG